MMTFFYKSECLTTLPSGPSVLYTAYITLQLYSQNNVLRTSSRCHFHIQLHRTVPATKHHSKIHRKRIPTTPSIALPFHPPPSPPTINKTPLPQTQMSFPNHSKWTCKCGQSFNLYEHRVDSTRAKISCTMDAVHSPVWPPPPAVEQARLRFLDLVAPACFCVAVVVWVYGVWDYVRWRWG